MEAASLPVRRPPRPELYPPPISASPAHPIFSTLTAETSAVFSLSICMRTNFATRMGDGRMSQDGTAQFQRSIVHLLRRVDQRATQLYMTESSDADLTLRQLAILTAISQQQDASQTDLVVMTGIDRSTVAGIVSRLLGKGLLERRRSPDDGRAYCVRLSRRGIKAIAGADRIYSKIEKKLLSGLPASEANQFVSTLKTLVAAQTSDEPQQSVQS
jgi:MarR family transcriptional regulator, lower aerobic nicotinate degradation pathway regulator